MNRLRNIKQSEYFSQGMRSRECCSLSSGSNYHWNDLKDKTLYMNKEDIISYALPSVTSQITGQYDAGNPVILYSFQIINGKVWISFRNYSSGSLDWIPVPGDPGDGIIVPVATIKSLFDVYGVLTYEQQQQQNAEENEGPLAPLVAALRSAGGAIIAAAFLYSVLSSEKR